MCVVSALALLLLWAPPEEVVYAVTTGARQPHPNIEHTSVYALDPDTRKERLLFSDQGSPVVLLPAIPGGGIADPMIASGGKRVFARGVERTHYRGGWHTSPAAVYELVPGGSGALRKVRDITGEHGASNFRNLFVHPAGGRIGYLDYLGGEYVLFIHESDSGRLLHRVALKPIALDCYVRNIGWLPGGNRLFFTLATGDEHVTSRASYARAGSYVMNEDGTNAVRLPRAISASQPRDGFRLDPEGWPVLLGALPDGRYVFQEMQWNLRPPYVAQIFFYTADPASSARRDLLAGPRGNVVQAALAPSGRQLLFAELQPQTREADVWILNLDAHQARRILTQPVSALSRAVAGWLAQ